MVLPPAQKARVPVMTGVEGKGITETAAGSETVELQVFEMALTEKFPVVVTVKLLPESPLFHK